MTHTCTECCTVIDSKARICPHCRSRQIVPGQQSRALVAFALMLGVAGWYISTPAGMDRLVAATSQPDTQ
ncbi:MAG TPA: hypothetical protein VKB96_15440 [Gammaproteobacteria bacterium]|nr:hypothetical protein [Gammaproteobacteria bacterium]